MKDIKSVDLHEAATFFECDDSQLPHGHLSQALRHAANVPPGRRHSSAKIITRSGAQYRWEEINVLHDHLRATDSKK